MTGRRFYYCPICGNIIEMIHDSGNKPSCCSKTMLELEAGTTDGAYEKHIPVCSISGNIATITVGKIPHPMESEHYIEWIEVITDQSVIRKKLRPGDEPRVYVALNADEEIYAIYSYCNKHKLWKAKL